jgi:hypothetical protein
MCRSIGLHSATYQISYEKMSEKLLLYELRITQSHFSQWQQYDICHHYISVYQSIATQSLLIAS